MMCAVALAMSNQVNSLYTALLLTHVNPDQSKKKTLLPKNVVLREECEDECKIFNRNFLNSILCIKTLCSSPEEEEYCRYILNSFIITHSNLILICQTNQHKETSRLLL